MALKAAAVAAAAPTDTVAGADTSAACGNGADRCLSAVDDIGRGSETGGYLYAGGTVVTSTARFLTFRGCHLPVCGGDAGGFQNLSRRLRWASKSGAASMEAAKLTVTSLFWFDDYLALTATALYLELFNMDDLVLKLNPPTFFFARATSSLAHPRVICKAPCRHLNSHF